MKDKLPGLALAAAAAAAAYGAHGLFPGFKIDAVVWAILFGMIAANAVELPAAFTPGLAFCEKRVLEAAVVLLGAGLSLDALSGLSPKVAVVLLGSMVLVLSAGPWFARRAGLNASTGFLLGAGSAICGSAAIAAVSPFVAREKSETALAVGIVNLVGFFAMLILPWVALQAGLQTQGAAVLLGGSLPAMGHAVGAGYAAGPEIGSLAIAVKMGRVLCLIPLVLGCSLWAARARGEAASLWSVVPWFVPVFIAAVALRSAGLIPHAALAPLAAAGKAALTAAMAAIGFGVNFSAVRRHGPKAFVLGTALILTQTLLVGFAVFYAL